MKKSWKWKEWNLRTPAWVYSTILFVSQTRENDSEKAQESGQGSQKSSSKADEWGMEWKERKKTKRKEFQEAIRDTWKFN